MLVSCIISTNSVCVMQNDALVAQMEGMSHEEQQQFLAQQVTERVSLPLVPPSTPAFSRCLAILCSPAQHKQRLATACPDCASTRNMLVCCKQTRHDIHLKKAESTDLCWRLLCWLHGICAAGAVFSLLFVAVQLNQLPTEEREAAIEGLLGHHHPCGEHCGHDHAHDHSEHHSKQHEHGPGCSHALQQPHTAEVASDSTKATSE